MGPEHSVLKGTCRCASVDLASTTTSSFLMDDDDVEEGDDEDGDEMSSGLRSI